MGDEDVQLPLQKRFEYEALRRTVQQAQDIEALRKETLKVIDNMEAQQSLVMQMLRRRWLGG